MLTLGLLQLHTQHWREARNFYSDKNKSTANMCQTLPVWNRKKILGDILGLDAKFSKSSFCIYAMTSHLLYLTMIHDNAIRIC